ncbi:hypothetical protein LDENG_00273150 [Lucifuga dentata]|nr:hypothetical protein LDENG_00273150 [Lucifuga dentata]
MLNHTFTFALETRVNGSSRALKGAEMFHEQDAAGAQRPVRCRSHRNKEPRRNNGCRRSAGLNGEYASGCTAMTIEGKSAKLQLRRSISEQLRDSTSKAWDLLWRNVRERRLAGQRAKSSGRSI